MPQQQTHVNNRGNSWSMGSQAGPLHHPCMAYSLFSSRPSPAFQKLSPGLKLKPKHSIMEGLSPPFLVKFSIKLSWDWWVAYLCFCACGTGYMLLVGKTECSLLCLEWCRDSWSLTNDFENCNVIENLNKFTNNPCWISVRCFSFCLFVLFWFDFCFLETGFHYVALDVLELTM